MFNDILTIVWKEWKELFLRRGNARSGIMSIVVVLGLLGIYMPLMNGVNWLLNPLMPFIWSWLPVFWAIGIVTDSFAGERERHTLETLLSSRLSDQAILYGKIATAVSYAWGIALLSMLIGAVTVNIANPGEGLMFYPVDIFFGGIFLSLLAVTLMSTIGVLVSLKAPNARQAYQRLSVTILALWLIPVIAGQIMPDEMKMKAAEFATGINLQQAFLIAALVLIAADAAMLMISRARFQRAKLILE